MASATTRLRRQSTLESSQSNPKPAPSAHARTQAEGSQSSAIESSSVGCWCRTGILVYLCYLCTLIIYFAVRLSQLKLLHRHIWYGVLVILAEAIGAGAIVLYGLCIIKRPAKQPADPGTRCHNKDMSFHIQVLVPCYSEALDLVAETVWAACEAELPSSCTSTVWLLDDGCDAAKQAWVKSLGQSRIRYMSHRRRPPGEVNGKSGNLNNILRKIYPRENGPAPANHLVAIFDCDQVCQCKFFLETLPLIHQADDVAMVFTPQQFGNVWPAADIFNHSNRHFWEVIVPGMVAWGLVVCTGSNLIIRARALQQVGFFPADTITEDFALGIELAKRKYRAVYLGKYLAQGEAPEEGAIFRQRSRWCKGHVQAFMSRDCPLAQPQLALVLRILFFSGTWSYFAAAVCMPVFILMPFIAIAFRIYPAVLSQSLLCAFVPYFIATHAVMYFCGSLDLLRALWFSSCATQILWYTYLKAFWNTGLYVLGLKGKGRFKTTVKTGVNAAIVEAGVAPGSLSRGVSNDSSLRELLESQTIPCHRPTYSAPSLLSLAATPRRLLKDAIPLIAHASPRAAEAERAFLDGRSAFLDKKEAAGPGDAAGQEAGGLQRTLTIPALQRQISLGSRPGWNLQVAPSMDGPTARLNPTGSPNAQSKPVEFERLRVHNISFGVLRDTWVPLVSLLISLWTVGAGLNEACRGGPRQAATIVTLCWACYNCLGPYLLIHYTWIGRLKSLERASAASMLSAAIILLSAAVSVWLFTPAEYDFGEVLELSYRFFEAQRSGKLPANNRVAFRGDSALSDRAPNGASLVGGWYDAGDHLKASFPTAVAATVLAWGLLEFPMGHTAAKQLEVGHDNLRWAAEYLVACHISPNEFVGQVGHIGIDHDYWGRPEDMEAAGLERPAYIVNTSHPGADVTAQAAAALAASSKVFQFADAEFSGLALEHAKQLFDFAVEYPGSFAANVPEMAAVYPSSSWRDDVAWAAAWLFVATLDQSFLTKAQFWLAESQLHEEHRWQYFVFNWDNMVWATNALLASKTSAPPATAAISKFVDGWRLGKVVDYTVQGLAFSDSWGTLRNAANAALLALIHAKSLPPADASHIECWALSQIRYALGDAGRSFVVGYGRKWPLRPHHRAASCPQPPMPCNISALNSEQQNPNVLIGALVGGPDRQDRYADDRLDYKASEVGIEYSAGFTAALAGLAEVRVTWPECLQLG